MIDDSVSLAFKGVAVRFPVQVPVDHDIHARLLQPLGKAAAAIPIYKRRKMQHRDLGGNRWQRIERKRKPVQLPQVNLLILGRKVVAAGAKPAAAAADADVVFHNRIVLQCAHARG